MPLGDIAHCSAARRRLYYGWIILGVGTLAVFASSPGQTYVVAVFVDPIQRETGWSRTLVSGLYTAGSLTAAAGMLLIGRLLDRVGARVILTIVGLLLGFAAAWMSRVATPLDLYVGFAFLRLLGQGALTVVATTMVALWFVRLRGRALALTSLGAVAGQALFPPFVHALIAGVDWRTAWVVLALGTWALVLPPAVLLVRRTPESIGLLPDGDLPGRTVAGARQPAQQRREEEWSLGEAVQTRAFWLLMLATSSQSLIATALTFHHVSFMGSRGIDPATAATVFAVIAPSSLVGTFLAGVLADRIAGRYLLAAAQGGLASAMLWSFMIATPWQAFMYGALLGLTGGFSFTLQSVIWPNYFGRRNLGSIRSVAATSMIAAAAIGPLPFGWMFDVTTSYSTPILVFLALPATSALAALVARPPRK